jgi:hypothetical protein
LPTLFDGPTVLTKSVGTSLEDAMAVRSVSRFVLRDSEKIIQFVDQYPMLTRKHEDYLKWENLVSLKESRAFDSAEGRALMESIKASNGPHKKCRE